MCSLYFGGISNIAPLFVSEPHFLFLLRGRVVISKVLFIENTFMVYFYFGYKHLLVVRCAELSPCAVDVFSCHLFSWHLSYLGPLLRILGDTANLC